MIQTTRRAQLSEHAHVSTYTVLFFPNKHYLLHCCLSLLGNSFLYNWGARAFSLVSGGLVARIQHPHFLSHTEALLLFFFREKNKYIWQSILLKAHKLKTNYKMEIYHNIQQKNSIFLLLFLLKTHRERSNMFVYSTHEDVFCECGLKQSNTHTMRV